MVDLKWEQNGGQVKIIIDFEDAQKVFLLPPKIINFLVSHTPKIYYLDFVLNGNIFSKLADFRELKPVVTSSGKLSVRIGKKKVVIDKNEEITDNYYTIKRGESFSERFLSPNGWQAHEYRFKIQSFDENVETIDAEKGYEKVENKMFNEQLASKNELKVSSTNKAKKCKNCGAIIDDDVNYCPHCFTPLFDKEDGVDYAI